MPDRLTTDIIDAELAPGARMPSAFAPVGNQATHHDITDEATAEIAAALQAKWKKWAAAHAVSFGKLTRNAAHSYAEDLSG